MTEAQFNSAIAIYHPTGGRKAGKVYDIKGASDLTVTGGGGTRLNKSGVWEEVPANMPKIDYSTGSPVFLVEPSRTNYQNYSYDLISDAFWTLVNGATATLNQVGITGIANTALLLTDDSTTNYTEITRSILPLSVGDYKVSTWIKKDNISNIIPEIYIRFRIAGVFLQSVVQLNTMTGEHGIRAGISQLPYEVLDRGAWWEVVIKTPNGQQSDRLGNYVIRPAISSTLGGAVTNNLTRSITIGHVGVYNSTVADETPIITNGAAVTRTASEISSAVAPGVSAIDIVLNGVSSTITTIPATVTFPEGKISSVIVR